MYIIPENMITVDILRQCRKQLMGASRVIPADRIRITDIRITIGGVVMIPGLGFLHLQTFKDVASPELYDYILSLPRVISEYDEVPE